MTSRSDPSRGYAIAVVIFLATCAMLGASVGLALIRPPDTEQGQGFVIVAVGVLLVALVSAWTIVDYESMLRDLARDSGGTSTRRGPHGDPWRQ